MWVAQRAAIKQLILLETLLHIPKPKDKSHIVWEHVIKTAVSFVGAYCLLFWGPMMLANRRSHSESDNEIAGYMVSHPEVHISLSLVICLIFNIYTYLQNSRKKCIVGVEMDDSKYFLTITNLYFNKLTTAVVNRKELKLVFTEKNDLQNSNSGSIPSAIVSSELKRPSAVQFVNSGTGELYGWIIPSRLSGSKDVLNVKRCLQRIREIEQS